MSISTFEILSDMALPILFFTFAKRPWSQCRQKCFLDVVSSTLLISSSPSGWPLPFRTNLQPPGSTNSDDKAYHMGERIPRHTFHQISWLPQQRDSCLQQSVRMPRNSPDTLLFRAKTELVQEVYQNHSWQRPLGPDRINA